jgi:hypothetical protein
LYNQGIAEGADDLPSSRLGYQSFRSCDPVGPDEARADAKDIIAMKPNTRVFLSGCRRLAGAPRPPGERRRSRPSLEALEQRVTPANYTWVGAQGGIWDNPDNWLGGNVPKSGVADIDLAPTNMPQTITLEADDVNFQVSSLTIESGSYTLIGPKANANQPFTLSDGVTLSVKNGGSLSFCTPFFQGGPGANSLSLSFLGDASETGTGTVFINNQSNAYAIPPGMSPFTVNSGTVVLGSSTKMAGSFFTVDSGATLLVPAGSMPSIGSLSVAAAATFGGPGSSTISGPATFNGNLP